MAMMAITTNSSMSVKAFRRAGMVPFFLPRITAKK
jgi:hypothetical protein